MWMIGIIVFGTIIGGPIGFFIAVGIVIWMQVEKEKTLQGSPENTQQEQQKNYQQILEEREQKFRLLADSMPQLVWTGDAQGKLNYFNQSVYNYSGLTELEVKEKGWLEIVHPDDKEENIEISEFRSSQFSNKTQN